MSDKKITDVWSEPSFDLPIIRYYLLHALHVPRSRSSAFALAKKYRFEYPDMFVRTLKVGKDYFTFLDEDEYNIFWEARKIALRNERRMKNETL